MNRRQIDIIESVVKIPNVLASHGVDPGYRRRCRCPLHHGKRNSFSYNEKLFHCFTCGESGGVIQLEAALSGVTENDACRALAARYGLDIDRPMTADEKRDYALECEVEKSFEEYQNDQKNYYRRMTNLFRNIRAVPELYDMAKDLRDWLDDNINGVTQPWIYQSMD